MSAKRFTGKTESDAVMNAAMELGNSKYRPQVHSDRFR